MIRPISSRKPDETRALASSLSRMNRSLAGLPLLLVSAASLAQAPDARVPVLVELFTSEGCSSCPPADALLAELAGAGGVPGAEVVPLSLHVDYWNRLGWTDPFSSAAFSERQAAYAKAARIYTPQMVVDGAVELVGSDAARARAAIRAASRDPKMPLVLGVAAAGASSVSVRVAVPPLPAGSPSADLLVALTEDGLVSDVARGENAGRKLPHAAVVRALERVSRATADAPLSADRTMKLDGAWRRDALHVVAFLQERSGRVVAVARAAVPR
jgi:hypothetical protein